LCIFNIETAAREDATVRLIETRVDTTAKTTVRKLSLTCGSEAKVVYHMLFDGWADHGVPKSADKAALLALIQLSNDKNDDPTFDPSTSRSTRSHQIHKRNSPRIVHCSAGVGRSGTFIALEHLLAELEAGALDHFADEDASQASGASTELTSAAAEHPDEVSLPDAPQHTPVDPADDPIYLLVDALRQQRPTMVQSEVQYAYLYEILAEEWIKRQRRLSREWAEHERMNGDGGADGGAGIKKGEPSPKAMRLGRGFKRMMNGLREASRSRGGKRREDGRVDGAAEGQAPELMVSGDGVDEVHGMEVHGDIHQTS